MEHKSNLTVLDSFELEKINGGQFNGRKLTANLININILANNNNMDVHTEDTLTFPIKVGSLLISLFSGLKSYTLH